MEEAGLANDSEPKYGSNWWVTGEATFTPFIPAAVHTAAHTELWNSLTRHVMLSRSLPSRTQLTEPIEEKHESAAGDI